VNDTPRTATCRLFFALWPTAAERSALAAASAMAVQSSSARAVPPENLHLTLAFLGAVPATRTAELAVLGAAVVAAADAAPPALLLDRLEHWQRPQILAAPAAGDLAALQALAAALKRAATAAGFLPDLKPFRAHVTVARQVRAAPASQPLAAVEWQCANLALVESRTEATGPAYSVLDSRLLGKHEKVRTQH
jgi:RNA 2',3'-cyclic 3'-phosphodiesterase